MTELFAASMAQTAQYAMTTEQFALPEEYNQVPTEDWILLKQDDLEEIVEENLECYTYPFDSDCPEENFAGIYCEESLEGNVCWKSCTGGENSDGEINEDCILRQPCICSEDSDGDIPKWCDRCPNPSIADDTLPRWLRLTAQILGTIFEFHVVFIAIFPWWALGVGLILVDLIFDYFWYLIFFAFCKPCAYVFVWILNIGTIPLHVIYWYQRLMLELIGFIFDFWTLFFNGDGCFLRWGRDCWLAKRMKYRDHLSYTDLVFLAVKQPGGYPRGFVWSDEQEKWYKVLGFPGSMKEFSRDMERRRASIGKNLKNGHGGFLNELTEKIAFFTNKLNDDIREVFDF